jgi:Spy/CpxP family protein refolding chaperone
MVVRIEPPALEHEMSETTQTTPSPEGGEKNERCAGRCAGRRRGRWGRKLFFVFFVAGLSSLPFAIAHAAGHGCHGWGPPQSADEVRDRVGRAEDRLLDKVDATDEQRARVAGVLDGLAPDLFRFHTEGREVHEDLKSALLAADAPGVEAARVDALALVDAASRRVAGAAVEIAGVLTPEQRQELAKLGERWHR